MTFYAVSFREDETTVLELTTITDASAVDQI